MTTVERDGATVRYETAGEGETVVLLGDAGYGPWQWGWQHAALAGPYRTVVVVRRGTAGAPSGPTDVATLAADLEAVLRDAAIGRAHLVGAGLGGMVALEYAREFGRARTLALCSTATHGAGIDVAACRDLDLATSDAFRTAQPDVVAGVESWREREDADDDGWRTQAAAVAAFDARDWLHEVTGPALVCHGTADAVWPVERGEALADGLPRGEFHQLDGAGHLVWVEHSRVVNDRLAGFLATHARPE
ncbi:MAG: alpha/beta fold hydrolase [Haloarculaceae archaeon]